MKEIEKQELYIKLVNIKNLLHNLNQDVLCFTDKEWDLIKEIFKNS